MADAQASGACYGNIVWVQVPFRSQIGNRNVPDFFVSLKNSLRAAALRAGCL